MALRAGTGLGAVLVCAVLAGCGAGQPAHAPSGRAVFDRECSGCHSLSGHNNPRLQGGDLLNFHSTRRQLVQLAGQMPVRHPLTAPELQAVVSFVMDVERRGG
jgi:mono/diheme cytochrome c family protein